MKKYVRIIDNDGYFLEDAFVDELTENTIETPCPSGFYKPKWDGEKWVEGGEAPEPKIKIEPLTNEEITEILADIIGGAYNDN